MNTIRTGAMRLHYNADFSGNVSIVMGEKEVLVPGSEFVQLIETAMLYDSAFSQAIRAAIACKIKSPITEAS